MPTTQAEWDRYIAQIRWRIEALGDAPDVLAEALEEIHAEVARLPGWRAATLRQMLAQMLEVLRPN